MADQHLGLDSFKHLELDDNVEAPAWAAQGGVVFHAHNTAEPFASGDPFVVPFDTVTLNTLNFGFAGGVVTVPEGLWLVEVDVTLQGRSNSRTNFDCWVTADGVAVPGTIGMLYCRVVNYGASAHLSTVIDVAVGASVDVGAEVDRTHGSTTGLFVAGGSRLAVHRAPTG